MGTYAYRLLPPRPEFWATVEPGELGLLARHLERLRHLKEQGAVRFVGRTETGGQGSDYGFVVIEARDPAEARRIAETDPAVLEGLMQLEFHAFLVVHDASSAAGAADPAALSASP